MKKIFIAALLVLFTTSLAYAGYVRGYTRSDGTYVRGYYRSDPDQYKWNNYGPSKSSSDYYNPYNRDNDNDGISNMNDIDDDNDGKLDDYDSRQYNPNR